MARSDDSVAIDVDSGTSRAKAVDGKHVSRYAGVEGTYCRRQCS